MLKTTAASHLQAAAATSMYLHVDAGTSMYLHVDGVFVGVGVDDIVGGRGGDGVLHVDGDFVGVGVDDIIMVVGVRVGARVGVVTRNDEIVQWTRLDDVDLVVVCCLALGRMGAVHANYNA